MKIVHVIERFTSAGPERAIIALAAYAAKLGYQQEHVVCTLEKAGSPVAVIRARKAGVQVLLGPEPAQRDALLGQADIVLVHFWNNPALYAFLRRPLPAMRLIIWCAILGEYPPQVIPRPLPGFADLFVATSPGTLLLPELAGMPKPAPVICAPADFARLAGVKPQPHAGFNVGYIGSLDSTKMHPAFVTMSGAAEIPGVRFIVCGAGGAAVHNQVRTLGLAGRFDFRGYVEDIGAVLALCDVFGYPLCPETSATSEKALQEAMWAGVPPVVFPFAGVRYLVEHGVTGIVVESEAAYTAALEWLYRNPDERRRLGRNAQEHARHAFDPHRAAEHFAGLFAALLAQPKRTRSWPADGTTPAEWFVAALGDHAGPFAAGLAAPTGAFRSDAEAEIAAISDFMLNYEGGLIHYRNRWPEDPHLRLWTGLALAQRGETDRAMLELQAAAASGLVRPGNPGAGANA